jgi:hypothetical protein
VRILIITTVAIIISAQMEGRAHALTAIWFIASTICCIMRHSGGRAMKRPAAARGPVEVQVNGELPLVSGSASAVIDFQGGLADAPSLNKQGQLPDVGRARFCLVCKTIKKDAARHKFDTGHEYRTLTADEKRQCGEASAPRPEGEYVFNFGKHKQRTLQQVLDREPSYIQWLLSPQGDGCIHGRTDLREALDKAGLLTPSMRTSAASSSEAVSSDDKTVIAAGQQGFKSKAKFQIAWGT